MTAVDLLALAASSGRDNNGYVAGFQVASD
jgi:hypothetical protein